MIILKEIWVIFLMYLDLGTVSIANGCFDKSLKMGKEETFIKLVIALILSKMAEFFYGASTKLTGYYTSLEEGL